MRLPASLALAMALLLPLATQAQGLPKNEDYPKHYITLIVPLAPGSGTDAIARMVGARLGSVLGAQIVVENKVGANGAIGTTAAARAAPDGYTLLVGGTTTHAGNPNLMKSVTYNPVTDFTPIGQLGVYPYALLVSAASGYTTMAQLVAAAKAKPGSLSYGYANALGQLSGELLKQRAGIDITAVAYRGSPQAITDIIGGRVTMMFVDVTPAIAQIAAGVIRPLAVTTEQRTDLLPNVPTLTEAGLGGTRVEAWNGLFAPAKTPKPIIDTLSAALTQVLAEPELRTRMAAIGFEAQGSTPDAFGKRVAAEVALWATLTKQAGMEPE